MKTPQSILSIRLPGRAAAGLACILVLFSTACSDNSESKAKIKQLEEELQMLRSDTENLSNRNSELEAKNAELRGQLSNAEQQATQAKREGENAQRELESIRTAKAAELEKARSEEPAKKLAAVKAGIADQLAAIVSIEGDVSKGRGFVVKADGKTWLYAAAQTFSGNSKLAIKDPSGTALTKFGEFQTAADSPVCRLEILQETAAAFELAPDAKVEASASFITASPTSDGGPLKPVEGRAADIAGNEFGFDVYLTDQANGCPVVAADSGMLVALLAQPPMPSSLWPDAQAAAYPNPSAPRAHRINRPIDWKKSALAAFLAERRKIDELNQITRLLSALALVRHTPAGGLELDGSIAGSSVTVRQVLEQHASLPLVAALKKLQSELTATKGVKVAERDINRRLDRIFQDAASIGKRQTQDFKLAAVSPSHKPMAAEAIKWRAEADQAIATAAQNMAK